MASNVIPFRYKRLIHDQKLGNSQGFGNVLAEIVCWDAKKNVCLMRGRSGAIENSSDSMEKSDATEWTGILFFRQNGNSETKVGILLPKDLYREAENCNEQTAFDKILNKVKSRLDLLSLFQGYDRCQRRDQVPNSADDPSELEATRTAFEQSNIFDILLAGRLPGLRSCLEQFARPTYTNETSVGTSVKGKINFSKTLARNNGLPHIHCIEINAFGYQHPSFKIIGFLVEFLRSKLILNDSNLQDLCAIEEITHTWAADSISDTDLMRVLYDIDALPESFGDLQKYARWAAAILLNMCETIDVYDFDKDRPVVYGFMLNLNMVMQRIILLSRLAAGSSLVVKRGSTIERLDYFDASFSINEATFKAFPRDFQPDCIEVRCDALFVQKYYWVIDSKHVLFDDKNSSTVDRDKLLRDGAQLQPYFENDNSPKKLQRLVLVGIKNTNTESKDFFSEAGVYVFESSVTSVNGWTKEVRNKVDLKNPYNIYQFSFDIDKFWKRAEDIKPKRIDDPMLINLFCEIGKELTEKISSTLSLNT